VDHAFHISIEYLLMLGYAIALALIALVLELAARHAHRRSLQSATIGFTYHREHDIWKCPRDQQLFRVFSDSAKGITVYRAPASACNVCPSKAACTDSDSGREIENRIPQGLEYGMQRFHRALSLMLLILADLILAIELIRTPGLFERLILAVMFISFAAVIRQLASDLRPKRDLTRPSESIGR
jgi:hypothetical protein